MKYKETSGRTQSENVVLVYFLSFHSLMLDETPASFPLHYLSVWNVVVVCQPFLDIVV